MRSLCQEGNDVLGDGVNIASRIEPLAHSGGICVSEDVVRQIRNKVEEPMVRVGTSELKNIELPVEIYRFVLPWVETEPVPSKPQTSSPAAVIPPRPRAGGGRCCGA